MWEKMTEPWKACFEEAWEAYCEGSIPIGAVIVSGEGKIISRGRNMIFEEIKEQRRISRSRLAHAEMNAMYSCKEDTRDTTIYSTMEPCVMCFGAIVMSRITEVNYAARDGVAGGINLENEFIKTRNIKINKNNSILEIVQLVIKTDFIYRNSGEGAERLLKVWEETCPIGIQLGRRWYKENIILNFKKNNYSIDKVINEISKELYQLGIKVDYII